MKVTVQIYVVLFSVTGGLMMNNNCMDNGSESLRSCQNHPNIRIKKVHIGGERVKRHPDGKDKGGGINRYSLSLRYSQNVWWEQPNKIIWIECKDLCDICESLPGNNDCNGNQCEQEVDRFLNNFCASATPITHTSTVTATQTTPSISATTSISISTVTETVTNEMNITVTSTMTTTKHSTIITTAMAMMNITPSSQNAASSQSPTIALGLLAGLFFIVLVAVIIGWVWTCWTIKKRSGGTDVSSKNFNTTTNEEERYFENPTYEDTSTRLNLTSGPVSDEAPRAKNGNTSAAVYSTISQNGGDGSTYDVLTRAQPTDHRQGQVVPGSEDYSQLGLRGNDVENNYQLLDKEEMGSKVKN